MNDKYKHIIAGFAVAIVFGLYDPMLGLTLAIIAGAAKELLNDKWLGRGYVELCDFTATVSGGTAGYLVICFGVWIVSLFTT